MQSIRVKAHDRNANSEFQDKMSGADKMSVADKTARSRQNSKEQDKIIRCDDSALLVFFQSGELYAAKLIGKGFLFMQSGCTLAQLSLPTGSNMNALLRGSPAVPRSVLLHYLTLGEYDQELCRDDFELACVRSELIHAVDGYDKETQVVYLMRFRCGHLAVGVVPLVPDYKLCLKLAKEYFGNQQQCQPLQLNIDDV